MKILGIDPGMAILGWSVVETAAASTRCLSFGCIRTAAQQPLTKRLLQISFELKQLIEEYKPDHLAIETLWFVKNAKTLAQVGHTRGVVLLAAGEFGVDVFEYAPRQIKMAVTGFGGADKKQMQLMIQRLLKLRDIPKPDDAADAVAVALCHTQFARFAGQSAVTV